MHSDYENCDGIYEWSELLGEELVEKYMTLVEDIGGTRVGMNSVMCMERRLRADMEEGSKGSCYRCETELGCFKFCRVMWTVFTAHLVMKELVDADLLGSGQEHDPNDATLMFMCGRWAAYVIQQILALTTVEGVRAFEPNTPANIMED